MVAPDGLVVLLPNFQLQYLTSSIQKVIRFNKDDKLLLRAFLIDPTLNENDWKVVSASIPDRIGSFKGMPLVLEQNYDHPAWQSGDEKMTPQEELMLNLRYQQRFAVGIISDVIHKDGKWQAIIEITDPLVREAIENNDDEVMPFYVSPRIIHDPNEPDDKISKWMGLHLAIVDKPAFGEKAKIDAACFGSAGECMIALKQAQKESCGFCVADAMSKLMGHQRKKPLLPFDPRFMIYREMVSN